MKIFVGPRAESGMGRRGKRRSRGIINMRELPFMPIIVYRAYIRPTAISSKKQVSRNRVVVEGMPKNVCPHLSISTKI